MDGLDAVVLYHADCNDGFGAAWAMHRVLGSRAAYIPVRYQEPPPKAIEDAEFIYILDFSYPYPELERIINLVGPRALLVIDHHKTAMQPLADLRGHGTDVVFDLGKSGAVLTWEYCHRGITVPRILEYVQDRDLWRWALPHSREVSAVISSYEHDFVVWDFLATLIELEPESVAKEGSAILRYKERMIESMARTARLEMIHGYQVPVANATTAWSEVAERLCELHPDAPFAVVYTDNLDRQVRTWSARSRGEFDVSEVAKFFGGGGHKNAAGWSGPYQGSDLSGRWYRGETGLDAPQRTGSLLP